MTRSGCVWEACAYSQENRNRVCCLQSFCEQAANQIAGPEAQFDFEFTACVMIFKHRNGGHFGNGTLVGYTALFEPVIADPVDRRFFPVDLDRADFCAAVDLYPAVILQHFAYLVFRETGGLSPACCIRDYCPEFAYGVREFVVIFTRKQHRPDYLSCIRPMKFESSPNQRERLRLSKYIWRIEPLALGNSVIETKACFTGSNSTSRLGSLASASQM